MEKGRKEGRKEGRYFRVSVIVVLSRWTMTNRCLLLPFSSKEHVGTIYPTRLSARENARGF